MYATRPLSLYKNNPSALSWAPPEGPNTGILVIHDEEAVEYISCFGYCKVEDTEVRVPPFPQNKIMRLRYSRSNGQTTSTDHLYGVLIPVLNQPLSSNKYYIINSTGKQKGLAYTSSKEEDMSTCCFGLCFLYNDIPPQPFDPRNPYQQFEFNNIMSCNGGGSVGFVAKSVGPDGIPPNFLRNSGWSADGETLEKFEPAEALGLDATLRAKLPEFNFSLPCKSSKPVAVAKWYCPFVFIKDGPVDAQVKESAYYQMTLDQNWEEIFECRNGGEDNEVAVDVSVERQVALGGGSTAKSANVADDVLSFAPMNVGLSLVIVERVRWEQERGGFTWGEFGERERVKRREEFKGMGEWRRFGCYVLVERYVLRRMDGSLVLTWEFKHTQQIRSKWD